jgi:hypothetical protein
MRPLSVSQELTSFFLICSLFVMIPKVLSASPKNGTENGFSIIQVRGDLLTVRVKNAPLEGVLKEIAGQALIKITFNGAPDETVSANFSNMPLDRGLKRLIRDVNVALVYDSYKSKGEDSRIREIIIYAKARRGSPRIIGQSKKGLKPESPRKPSPPVEASPQALLKALKDEDPAVREEAVARLEAFNEDKRFINQLTAFFLGNEDPEIKTRVGEALEDFLVPEIRLRMIEAMGKIGGKKAIEPLKGALEDEDEEVRKAAAVALEKLIGKPVRVHEESALSE